MGVSENVVYPQMSSRWDIQSVSVGWVVSHFVG